MMAARYGIARGLFSNESGLGSAPIVAAAAQTRNPVRQALVSSTGTFWDTVVICALTGLVLVSSILAYPDIDYTSDAALTKMAFAKIPYIGTPILSFWYCHFLPFSTIFRMDLLLTESSRIPGWKENHVCLSSDVDSDDLRGFRHQPLSCVELCRLS